jgi:hypothetical protein
VTPDEPLVVKTLLTTRSSLQPLEAEKVPRLLFLGGRTAAAGRISGRCLRIPLRIVAAGRITVRGEGRPVGPGQSPASGTRAHDSPGKIDRVLALRHDFQEAMREELVALVEAHVGRRVVAFMSANHVDPDLAVEMFILGD